MQMLVAASPRDRDLWEMYMTWQPLKRKPLHLPSLICLSLSPPLDPVAAVPALPHMLHLPKKTLNQGWAQQINHSYIAPTNRHSGWFYVCVLSPIQEGRVQKYFAVLPFNPETHDFMGLWSAPRTAQREVVGVQASGLPGWFMRRRVRWRSSRTPRPRQEIKEMETAISGAVWPGFRALMAKFFCWHRAGWTHRSDYYLHLFIGLSDFLPKSVTKQQTLNFYYFQIYISHFFYGRAAVWYAVNIVAV